MIAATIAALTLAEAPSLGATDTVQHAALPGIAERLRAWIPETRIDEGVLARAWSAHDGPRCRLVSFLWRRDAPDGALRVLHESRCRDDAQALAPHELAPCRLLAVAFDATGLVVWWSQMRDPREVRPALAPPTGDPGRDRESQELHARTRTAASAAFDLAIPGDPRIHRLALYEPIACPSDGAMRQIGSVPIALAPSSATRQEVR